MKKNNKKIAFIISSLEIGGAEKMVLDLIENIKDNISIKLFVIKKNLNTAFDKLAKELKIDIVYLNNPFRFFNVITFLKLKQKLDSYMPDIIHTHLKASSYIYFYYFFNKKFKWVHTIHTIAYVDTKFIRRLFFRKLYNKNKIKLVAVSNGVYASSKILYKNANVSIICNGIDLNRFRNQNTNKNKVNINLINVGRFEVVKNHDYLLQEVSKLNKELKINKLILIGDGKRKKHIEDLIKKLGIDKITNIISYTSRVCDYLNASDIFILPSFYEGLPLSVIEALACGLIVITSNCATDVIEDNYNGFIINLEKDALYNKLKEIITDITKYEYIRENARETAKNYSIKKMAEEYLKIYLED